VDVSQAIKTAHQAVVEADLPPELHQVAFAQVLRHTLSGTAHRTVQHPDRPKDYPEDVVRTPGLSRLAAKVGVGESALADIFEINGDVTLHVASSRIDSVKSKATREIALLVAAARQGSGADDAWTATSHVRDAAQQYNRYDTNNFAAYLRKTGDVFNFRGKGSSLEVRLTKPGWEAATALIRSLTGDE